jgi:uncharacterized protein (DUF1697 family)
MAALRDTVSGLGFTDVATLLQSGNVVFRAPTGAPAAIELLLGRALSRRLAVTTDVFVRSAAEWAAHIRANPFRAEAKADPGRLHLLTLKDAPAPPQVAALRGAIRGRERVGAKGRALYAVYPDGAGRSRLTIALIERHLDTRATARNWNTVLKLADLAAAG